MYGYKFIESLIRRKIDDFVQSDIFFKCCMNVFDLIVFGIGGLIDVGLYVVIGQFVYLVVGLVVIVFFLIVVVIFFLVGMNYVEFLFRVSCFGFGYIYMYVGMGEIWVFVIGWCMIIEYVLFVVFLVLVCSEYINFFFNGFVYKFFEDLFGFW